MKPGRALPMTKTEMKARGWDQCDIILVTGDAYVDHPSFGAALIGRWLEHLGYKVGIIAAPAAEDVESFRVLGPPRLFWGVTAGNLDSQLARLTVMRKRRRDDPYLPEGQGDLRPPNATIVYVTRVRQAFKETRPHSPSPINRQPSTVPPSIPVIIGGLEASLRRFPYYDYWTDSVKRSLLFDSKADLLVYGMAERAIAEVAARLTEGKPLSGITGTCEILRDGPTPQACPEPPLALPSFEAVAANKDDFNRMTREILLDAASQEHRILTQSCGDRMLVVHPPSSPLTQAEFDTLYALPFTRKPHPSYGGKRIAACDMIKDSITTHRGCYGACAFCAIAAHQGKTILSRSQAGILSEIRSMTASRDFHGTISDLGGPSANMYGTRCRKGGAHCRRPSCLAPDLCPNLECSPGPQLNLWRAARKIPGVKHVFVTSGIRFDLALTQESGGYIPELAAHHVCGRLKIAPEHVSAKVLRLMGKPPDEARKRFIQLFRNAGRQAGKPWQVVEYFISGHPGCTTEDMIDLALYLKREQIRPEQVQDFYPAPLTAAAAMFHTGVDPMTGEKVYVARTDNEKAMQRALLLAHDPKFHRKAREALRKAGREDLIGRSESCLVPPGP